MSLARPGQRTGAQFSLLVFDADQDGWQDLCNYNGLQDQGRRWERWLRMCWVNRRIQKTSKARLYRNREVDALEDQTQSLGLDQVLHTMGSNYGDVNNDGYPDFYLGTGDPDLATLIPNRLFLNQGGERFATSPLQPVWDISKRAWDWLGGSGQLDGDQDVYANMGGAYEGDLYRNALFLNPGRRAPLAETSAPWGCTPIAWVWAHECRFASKMLTDLSARFTGWCALGVVLALLPED